MKHKRYTIKLSFEQVAKDVSDDKVTAGNGGLMPFFAKEDVERAFAKEAFILKNEGDISNIMHTKDGFEIIQFVSRKKPTYKSLNDVKIEIADLVAKNKFEKKFMAEMKQIAHAAHADELMQDVIQKHDAKLVVVPLTAMGNDALSAELFRSKQDKFSFYVQGGKGFLMRVTDIKKRHIPALSSIKDLVVKDLRQAHAVKALQKQLELAKVGLKNESVQDVASAFNASREQTNFIQKTDKDVIQKMTARGLPVDRMLELIHVGSVVVAQGNGKGYVIRLDELEKMDQDDFLAKMNELKAAASSDLMARYVEAVVASLYRNATIKTDQLIENPSL
jgi:hypothetical protein